jgi:tetratricopeptide (TPR) repeat protein
MTEKIKEAIADDSLILFVGAGMSMPFKIPNWTNLIIQILEELHKKHGDKSLVNFKHNIDLLKSNSINVFDVLSQIENRKHRPEAEKILYSIIDKVEYEDDKLTRHKKLWLISDKIITTNYDTALEAVLPKGIKPYTYDNEFQQQLGISGSPFLYKMHGDISDPTKCILFESDYKKLYVEENAATQSLRSFLLNKTILFLGFSMEDPFIKNQLDFLSKIYKGHNNIHYIVSNRTTDLDGIENVPVEDWEESFDTLLDELIEAKKENSKNNTVQVSDKKDDVDISEIEDTVLLEEMFDEKREEFGKAEDHLKKKVDKELRVIKDRMIELRTLQFNLDFKIPDHDQNELKHVFDTIYNSEILSDLTKEKINKIKDLNTKTYQWYHRSVIISALACSLVNHKKIDVTKIDLLIDFVNESEPKVWQKAITYLFIILNFLGNRWIRHKKKLESKIDRLKLNPEIQESLKRIIYFMQIGLQRENGLGKYIFENKYFKDNPFNYFLPFFKENPSVDNLYNNDGIEDIENFIEFLYDVPLPDSFKYLICNQESLIVKEKPDNELDEARIQDSLSVFTTHIAFEPYLNYASEFLNFYENHPDINKSINEKGTIVEVKNLKNYLLNTIEHHRALARQFMIEEQWGKAITHYEQLLVIEKNDIFALKSLIICFENTKKSNDDRLKLCLRIEKLEPNSHKNLFRIGILYLEKNKNKIALKYLNTAITFNDKDANYYAYRGKAKVDLKDNKGAILDLNKAIDLDDKKASYYAYRGEAKDNLQDNKGAISDLNKAIDLDDKKASYFAYRAKVKGNLQDYKSAILDFNKAIELDNKETSYFFYRGIIKSRLKEHKGAILDYNIAITLDDKNATFFNSRGYSKRNLKDFEGALLDSNIAITLDDKNATFFNRRGYVKRDLQDFEGALQDFNKAIELDPKNSDYFDNRGTVKVDLEDNKGAILDYNKAIELDDKNASAYNGKANSLRRINNYDEALNFIDLAININEEDGRHYGTKATIYASQGNDKKFYELLEIAFQLNAKAWWLSDDIKEKYKEEKRFQELLKKYDQSLEDEK